MQGEGILEENSLLEIGMLNAQHRKIVSLHAQKLEVSWPRALDPSSGIPLSVEKWLQELHLDHYLPIFRKNRYNDPERLLRLSNDELTTLIEIEPVGHRRRILAASVRISNFGGATGGTGLNADGRTTAHYISSQAFGNGGIGISNSSAAMSALQHHQLLQGGAVVADPESDGSLPLRDPNFLVSGVSSALKTAWRHTPETLINGSVTYQAVYVGWSPVQEYSTTDCIQKAIQQIRTQEGDDAESGAAAAAYVNGVTMIDVEVTLIVSATVISWYNAKTKVTVQKWF